MLNFQRRVRLTEIKTARRRSNEYGDVPLYTIIRIFYMISLYNRINVRTMPDSRSTSMNEATNPTPYFVSRPPTRTYIHTHTHVHARTRTQHSLTQCHGGARITQKHITIHMDNTSFVSLFVPPSSFVGYYVIGRFPKVSQNYLSR